MFVCIPYLQGALTELLFFYPTLKTCQGAAFGDTSMAASSADQGQLAVDAAQRAGDGALTLMIINKSAASLTSQISLAGFTSAGTAQVYRYSAANAQ